VLLAGFVLHRLEWLHLYALALRFGLSPGRGGAATGGGRAPVAIGGSDRRPVLVLVVLEVLVQLLRKSTTSWSLQGVAALLLSL